MTSLHCTRAIEFVEQFCSGNVDGLSSLLAPDLIFRGPFHEFDSREAYLQSLFDDPPEPASCRLISVTEAHDSVAVFYEYEKDAGSLTIAQWFRFRDAAFAKRWSSSTVDSLALDHCEVRYRPVLRLSTRLRCCTSGLGV